MYFGCSGSSISAESFCPDASLKTRSPEIVSWDSPLGRRCSSSKRDPGRSMVRVAVWPGWMVPDGDALRASWYWPYGVVPLAGLTNVSVDVTKLASWIGLLETFL